MFAQWAADELPVSVLRYTTELATIPHRSFLMPFWSLILRIAASAYAQMRVDVHVDITESSG